MRRRATAYRASTNDSTVLRNVSQRSVASDSERRTTATTQLSICRDEVGNVRGAGMADEGVGGPVSLADELRPTVTNLGSGSEGDSSEGDEEEELSDSSGSGSDSSDDSDDDNAGVRPTNTAPDNRGQGPGTDENVVRDGCMSVVPSGGALQAPMQPQTGNIASYGNISVKGSTGIHFGNKTVYHGPVIIEQHVYGPKVVKQLDDSLQLKYGGGPLAITNGSESVVQLSSTGTRRTGLELNSGSFRIGATSTAVSKGGSGLLWRHLLGRRPGSSTWVAWIALSLGCMAVLAVILTVTILNPPGRKLPVVSPDTGDVESEELTNGYKTPAKQQNRTILNRRRLVVVPRREWVAQPPKSTKLLKHPVEYVIISHTASEPCTTQAECTLTVRYIQVLHVEGKKWMDISYNFLVAGDGQAYEGRGWDVVGAHTAAGFNSISVGISFVGTFNDVLPSPVQMRACQFLIEEGVKLGKISPNYKLIADRQVSASGNPGEKLFEELKTWPHWTSDV